MILLMNDRLLSFECRALWGYENRPWKERPFKRNTETGILYESEYRHPEMACLLHQTEYYE